MNNSNSSAGVKPALDAAALIDRYLQLRDRKRELEAVHKEQLKPYKQVMDEIEGRLLTLMQTTGVKSLPATSGTAYQSTTPSATIKDRGAFREWVVQNEQFALVDWRANAPAVFTYIAENDGVPPPGVNTSTFTKVNVRRPNEKE